MCPGSHKRADSGTWATRSKTWGDLATTPPCPLPSPLGPSQEASHPLLSSCLGREDPYDFQSPGGSGMKLPAWESTVPGTSTRAWLHPTTICPLPGRPLLIEGSLPLGWGYLKLHWERHLHRPLVPALLDPRIHTCHTGLHYLIYKAWFVHLGPLSWKQGFVAAAHARGVGLQRGFPPESLPGVRDPAAGPLALSRPCKDNLTR